MSEIYYRFLFAVQSEVDRQIVILREFCSSVPWKFQVGFQVGIQKLLGTSHRELIMVFFGRKIKHSRSRYSNRILYTVYIKLSKLKPKRYPDILTVPF